MAEPMHGGEMEFKNSRVFVNVKIHETPDLKGTKNAEWNKLIVESHDEELGPGRYTTNILVKSYPVHEKSGGTTEMLFGTYSTVYTDSDGVPLMCEQGFGPLKIEDERELPDHSVTGKVLIDLDYLKE